VYNLVVTLASAGCSRPIPIPIFPPGLLSVFADLEHEILRERIRAGIAEARLMGKHFGRPLTAANKASQIRKLY
jgi:hypothetical protein